MKSCKVGKVSYLSKSVTFHSYQFSVTIAPKELTLKVLFHFVLTAGHRLTCSAGHSGPVLDQHSLCSLHHRRFLHVDRTARQNTFSKLSETHCIKYEFNIGMNETLTL